MIPGRKIMKSGQKTDWMYVDGWYLLGPFDNANRINRQRQFPPESVVDLNATYTGKDGQQIRWRFYQSGEPLVEPPNAEEYTIWYAFTELEFEEAMDLWIAVGSDDRSDIWINGQRVWASSNDLKSWRMFEGFRKVHFDKGRNRVLYRIENGWLNMGFSLMILARPDGKDGSGG